MHIQYWTTHLETRFTPWCAYTARFQRLFMDHALLDFLTHGTLDSATLRRGFGGRAVVVVDHTFEFVCGDLTAVHLLGRLFLALQELPLAAGIVAQLLRERTTACLAMHFTSFAPCRAQFAQSDLLRLRGFMA